jgi:glycosyltransferase involved in cell wall biosynthesis
MLALVKEARRIRPDIEHAVVSLRSGDYMPLLFQLRQQGVAVTRGADVDTATDRIAAADVVLIHFWNTPEMWRLLAAGLPESRYILWSKVLGAHSPQRLSTLLLSQMGAVMTTADLPPELSDRFPAAITVPGISDWDRLAGLVRRRHDGFNADYIGTTNLGKMHPRFVRMMARLNIPGLKVRICGGALDPAMQGEIDRLAHPERFACLGFVEDVRSILETSDVFAYPLAENSYATSDKSLQEAMYAGVAPIVMADAAPSRFVRNGYSGLVARGEDEFVAGVEYLYLNPAERTAMGLRARESALSQFSTEANVASVIRTVDRIGGLSRCAPVLAEPGWLAYQPSALLFLLSQNWPLAEAASALTAWQQGRSERLLELGLSFDAETFQVEGGILQWRRQAMDDALIRSWTGLWLHRTGRLDEARREFAEAERLGAPRVILAKFGGALLT